jgi:hypothetical protein
MTQTSAPARPTFVIAGGMLAVTYTNEGISTIKASNVQYAAEPSSTESLFFENKDILYFMYNNVTTLIIGTTYY